MNKCPVCGSKKIRPYKYNDVTCFECDNCSYDSCEEFEEVPEEKTSQKAKGRYTPYKAGGSKRTK